MLKYFCGSFVDAVGLKIGIFLYVPHNKEEKRMKRTYSRIGIAILTVFFVLPAVSAWAAKDVLVVINNIDPSSLDPINTRDIAASTVCAHIYDNLVKLDTQNKLLPGLAESWEETTPTEVTFHLRKNAVFHNGEKFTADDVKYSMDRSIAEGLTARLYTQNIESVEASDPYTIVFRLKNPDKDFPAKLSSTPFCIVNRKAVEELGDAYLMNPVGTGPFKMHSWSKGDRITLERNEDYWGKKPAFKTLIHRVVPETSSRLIELESGLADISLSIGRNDIKRVEEHPNLKLARHLLFASTFIGMNAQKPPLDNPKVREAIWSALDIEAMYKAVVGGIGELSSGILPATIQYYVPYRRTHERDPERAKQLLKEAGIEGRLKVEIWMNENKERMDLMTIAQSFLSEVGIDAELKVLEMGIYSSAMQRKEHDIFIYGRSFPLPIADTYLTSSFASSSIGGMNYCCFSDPEVDKLLDEARVEQDLAKRAELYKTLQYRLEDLTAWIPVYTMEQVAGMQKNVENFNLDAKGYYDFSGVTFSE
jgi:peptide/nickel transport system substrate-binding protein